VKSEMLWRISEAVMAISHAKKMCVYKFEEKPSENLVGKSNVSVEERELRSQSLSRHIEL
jgi:hypothetical protein